MEIVFSEQDTTWMYWEINRDETFFSIYIVHVYYHWLQLQGRSS